MPYRTAIDKVSPRSAFTLVEMLVALAIILVIATLIVAFGPGYQKSEKASRGADLVQRWLLVAKQRARRDLIPRGIHLVVDPTTNYATTLQYIEQPDDYFKGQVTSTTYIPSGSPPPPYNTAILNVDISDGFASTQWPVQPGDFLEINKAPPEFKIDILPPQPSIMPGVPGPGQTSIRIANSNLPAVPTPTSYRIIRAPRTTQGEPPLELPQDVVIDLNLGRSIAPVSGEILFLPGGGCRRSGATNKFILWVHDINDPNPGTQHTLITVYVTTGFIAAHPVDTSSGDFYSYTRDGRSSGI